MLFLLDNAGWNYQPNFVAVNVDWTNQWYLSKNEASHHSFFLKLYAQVGDSGEKSPSKDMENFFFPTFKFVIISFCTWKPNPLGLGNCSVPNFCKTGFRYFCSLFTCTLDKFILYAVGLFMSKKSKLLTRKGWFRVFLKLRVENHNKN